MNHLLVFAAALGLSAAPGLAQGTPQTGAAAANDRVAAQARARQGAVAQDNADAQAAYRRDMAAYDQSLRDHHRAVRRGQRRYQHQQRAYADAMAAWRRQVHACRHGSRRACNAPAPRPADYW